MLDPSLPWLAVGYRNLRQEDFCQRRIREEITKYRIDTTDLSMTLRSSTRQGQQRRRVKSATVSRLTGCCHGDLRTPATARPKSAKLCSYRAPSVGQNPEKSPVVLRQRRPHSAFLLTHQASPTRNQSVAHKHNLEKNIQLFVDGHDSRCLFCPVDSRPKSSVITRRPLSSSGLVSAHTASTHDRYVSWTRPRTAPSTRREFQQLPKHNNIHRGNIPHYTSFVKRIELRPRKGIPASLPSRRKVCEEDSAKHHSPSPEPSSNLDEKDRDVFLSEEENTDDEFDGDDDASVCVATSLEPHLDDEYLYEDVGPRTGEMPKAPTPSPAVSGRASPEPQFPVKTELMNEAKEPVPPRELTPSSISPPREPSPPPREPSPPPREPSPPPQEPYPPPQEPYPPPRKPSPPPQKPSPALTRREPSPAPPQQDPLLPPQEPTPPLTLHPREGTPPSIEQTLLKDPNSSSSDLKPRKQVQIKETPVQPPTKPKSSGMTKPCLSKKSETSTQQEPSPDDSPEQVTEERTVETQPSTTEEGALEDFAVTHAKEKSEQKSISPNAVIVNGEQIEQKTKLGPPPKYKVDLFALDSQELLDAEMKFRRKEIDNYPISSAESLAPPIIPEHLLRRKDPWQHGRLALSCRACRFELPMDIRQLENMTPTEYLQKHCIVNARRRAMYQRAFNRADKDNDMKLNVKEFYCAVFEALVGTVNSEQIQDVLRLIEAKDFTQFTPQLFCAICSLLERLHFKDFVTDDTVNQESFVEKERVEDADFLALDWKFEGCLINPTLKRLLYML